MSIINPSNVIVLTGSTALLTSLGILSTNGYISKLELRYTKLRDWISFITILFEKTKNQSMVDKKNDEKEALELKKKSLPRQMKRYYELEKIQRRRYIR